MFTGMPKVAYHKVSTFTSDSVLCAFGCFIDREVISIGQISCHNCFWMLIELCFGFLFLYRDGASI